MKRGFKILAIIGILGIALVVGGIAVLKSLDFNQYKGLIAEQVKAATGRDVVIAGDLNLQISLNPAITVEGVIFANAPWGSRPEMVKLDRLSTEVALLPLLSGDIRVNRLVLIGLDVLVETDAKGRGNWEFASTEKKEETEDDGEAGLLPVVQMVRMENVRIVYKDGVTGEKLEVVIDGLEVAADSASSPLQIAIQGQYNGTPYEVSGRLGSIETLINGGKPYTVAVKATALGADIGLDGSIANPREVSGFALTASVKGSDLAKTIKAVQALAPALKELNVPDIGAYDLSARIEGSLEKLAISELSLKLGQEDKMLLTVTGGIGDAITVSGLDLSVAAKGPDLAATVGSLQPVAPALADTPIPDLGPYDLAARLKGSLTKLSVTGIKVSVGRPEQLTVTVNGGIGDAITLSGLDLSVAAKGPDLAATVGSLQPMAPALADAQIPDLGPYDLAARIKGSLTKLSVTGIEVSVGRPEQLMVTVNGRIGDAIALLGLDLKVAIQAKDISPLSGMVDTQLPDIPPFSVNGRLTGGGDAFALEGFKAKVGNSDLSGSAAISLKGARPKLNVQLASTLLDLDELLPPEEGQPASSQAAPTAGGAKDGRVFPADPLPLDGLKAVDATVKFSAGKIVAKGMTVRDFAVDLKLVGGRLEVQPFKMVVSDGRIGGRILLDSGKAVPELAVKVNAKQIDYGALLKQFELTDIASGKTDLEIDIKGTGKSVRAIMAGLNGRVKVVSQGGRVESGLLNILSADILSALPMVESKGDKDIRCVVVDFDIKSGQAVAKTILLDTGGISLIGKGKINLADETLGLSFNSKAKKVSLLQAAIPFSVGGTLASPTVAPDVGAVAVGAVKAVAGTVTGIAKGGLSVVGALTGLGGGGSGQEVDETDYCKLALAGRPLVAARKAPAPSTAPASAATAEPAPAKEKSAVGTVVDTVTGTVGAVGEGITNTLKSLFGD